MRHCPVEHLEVTGPGSTLLASLWPIGESTMQSQEQHPASQAGTVFSRILVPVDFKPSCHPAIHLALDLQRIHGAQVCVFNAGKSGEGDRFLSGIGSPTEAGDISGESRDALARLVDNIAPGQAEKVECDANLADDFADAIRGKVTDWKASVVLLTHEAHHSLLRTPTEKLVHILDVPVLVLPPPG
jgi:nucleotide-binding universal stress UspA family protein